MNSTLHMKSYAKQLLARVGYTAPIAVIWNDDAITASTNGLVITMPKVFLGIKLWSPRKTRPSKRTMAIIKGLLLHEIGHSLQPLAEITKVERATNLHHDFVNIFLDVHLERVAMVAFKSEVKYLFALRKLIRRKMMAEYIDGLVNGTDFPTQAMDLNLIGRFRQYNAPYHTTNKLKKSGFKVEGKLQEFDYSTMMTPGLAASLPAQVQLIADQYPELCNLSLNLPQVPFGSPEGYPGLIPGDEESAEELRNAGIRMIDILETIFIQGNRKSPRPAAVRLAQKLNAQISKEYATTRILAPQKIDRRKLATGDIQPYYAERRVGKAKARRCTILLDTSYSMVRDELQEAAFVAAQAIALTVERQGGNVCGGQFGAYGILSKDMGAALLFDDIRGNNTATSFQLVSAVWQFKKQDTVIIITDGDGTLPAVILPKDYARTHVIKLGDKPAPGIELMGTLHECSDIKQLPEIMLKIVD